MKKTRPASKSSARKSGSVRHQKSRFWNKRTRRPPISMVPLRCTKIRAQACNSDLTQNRKKSINCKKLMLPSDKAPYCISVPRRNTMVPHGYGTRRSQASRATAPAPAPAAAAEDAADAASASPSSEAVTGGIGVVPPPPAPRTGSTPPLPESPAPMQNDNSSIDSSPSGESVSNIASCGGTSGDANITTADPTDADTTSAGSPPPPSLLTHRAANEDVSYEDIHKYPSPVLRFVAYYNPCEGDKPYHVFLAAIGHSGLKDPALDETIAASYKGKNRNKGSKYDKSDVIRTKCKSSLMKELERRLVVLNLSTAPKFLLKKSGTDRKPLKDVSAPNIVSWLKENPVRGEREDISAAITEIVDDVDDFAKSYADDKRARLMRELRFTEVVLSGRLRAAWRTRLDANTRHETDGANSPDKPTTFWEDVANMYNDTDVIIPSKVLGVEIGKPFDVEHRLLAPRSVSHKLDGAAVKAKLVKLRQIITKINHGYFESGEGMGSHSSKPQATDVSVSVAFVERGGKTADIAYTRERFRQEGELDELLSQVPKKSAAGMAGVSRIGKKKRSKKKRSASSSTAKDKSRKMAKSAHEKALKILEKSHLRLEASEAKLDLDAARLNQSEAFRNALEAKKALMGDPEDPFLQAMFAEAQEGYESAKQKVVDLEESLAGRDVTAEGSSSVGSDGSDSDDDNDEDDDNGDGREEDKHGGGGDSDDDNSSVKSIASLNGDRSVGDGSLNDIMEENFEMSD